MESATRSSVITGWGHSAPEHLLTNHDLERMVDTSDEWIVTRTGIRERHIAGPGENTLTSAVAASQMALDRASVRPEDLDLIMVGTVTPNYVTPATSCLLQDALGAHCPAFDYNAACSGFIYGLTLAHGMICIGQARTVLLVGSETLSRIMDYTDRATCVLFGDGAGAAVIEASGRPGGIRESVLGADGANPERLWVPGGMFADPNDAPPKPRTVFMNGQEVFRFATVYGAIAARQVLDRTGWSVDEIKLLVPHQANIRIIDALRRRLELPEERVFVNIDRYGNTSSASIGIALSEAAEAGLLAPGDKLLLAAFGAGLTWGAMTLEWGA
jgi:3-oxoacyl-[acyl-carrier-protein] synthase-3